MGIAVVIMVMTAAGGIPLAIYLAQKRAEQARLGPSTKQVVNVTGKGQPSSQPASQATGQSAPSSATTGARAGFVVDRGRFVRGLEPNRRVNGVLTPHWGIDIGGANGTPVRAVKSGTVLDAGPRTGYGNCITLQHDDGRQSSLYGHLNSIGVRSGQRVSGGQQIGTMGRTTAGADGVTPPWGRTMGVHLHMEIHPTPRPTVTRTARRLDPVAWLRDQEIEQYGTWA